MTCDKLLIVGADISSYSSYVLKKGKNDVPQLDVFIIWISAVSHQPDIRDQTNSAGMMTTANNGCYNIGIYHIDVSLLEMGMGMGQLE